MPVTVSRILIAFAALLLSTPIAHALEGGRPASPSDPVARATVAVQAVEPDGKGRARFSECTGFLIAPDLVLTAAHCLDIAAGPDRVAVFLFEGSGAVPPPLTVAKIVRHPDHRRGWAAKTATIENRQNEISADYALLRLAEPAPRMPLTLGGMPSDWRLLAAGQAGPEGSTGTLKSVALGNQRATRTGANLTFATPAKARVCRGDSGGPIVSADGRVWGIAGAVLRAQGGCAARLVAVPIDPSSQAFQRMLGLARAR